MRKWTLANEGESCGFCGQAFVAGAPAQELVSPLVTRRLRCVEHADGPVDEAQIDAAKAALERLAMTDHSELTPSQFLAQTTRRVAPPRPVKAFSTIAEADLFDLKFAATGERD